MSGIFCYLYGLNFYFNFSFCFFVFVLGGMCFVDYIINFDDLRVCIVVENNFLCLISGKYIFVLVYKV